VLDLVHRILVDALIGEPATGGRAREQELHESDDITLVRHDRDRFRDECLRAYETIAGLYAAATGRDGEPPASSDLVADVAAVRKRLLDLEKLNQRLSRSLYVLPTPAGVVAAPEQWQFEVFDRSATRRSPDQPLARLSATGEMQLNAAAFAALTRSAIARTGQESAAYVEVLFDRRRGGLSLVPCVAFSPDRSFPVVTTVFNDRSSMRGLWPVKVDVREALNCWRLGPQIPPWQELPVVVDCDHTIIDLTGCARVVSSTV